MSVAEISTLLRDRVPSRTIAYPIGVSQFQEALDGVVPLQQIGLYFLYDSSPQVGYYDPAKSQLERYPILVVRPGLAVLSRSVLAGDLADDPEARAILVFPVKARIKPKVSEVLRDQGMRPIVRWFTCAQTPGTVQRPLVLVYDEAAHRILLANVYKMRGQNTLAELAYKKAHKDFPASSLVFANYAAFLRSVGRPAAALALAEDFTSDNAQSPAAWKARADLCPAARDRQCAASSLEAYRRLRQSS